MPYPPRTTGSESTLATNAAGWVEGWYFIRSYPREELKIIGAKLRMTYSNDSAGLFFAGKVLSWDPSMRRILRQTADAFWWIVLALAAAGLFTLRGWSSAARVLVLGAPLTWLVLHAAFLGGARYHLPETPALALIAACSLRRLAPRVSSRLRRSAPVEASDSSA